MADEFLSTISATDVVNEEQVQKIVSYLTDSADSKLIQVLQLIGDLCRNDENRVEFGKNEQIYTELINHIKQSATKQSFFLTDQFVLRAIGNLAYQNEENRNKLVALGVSDILIEKLKNSEKFLQENIHAAEPALRNFAGTIVNLTFVCDEEIEKFEEGGVLSYFYRLIDAFPTPEIVIISFRALTNFAENEKVKERLGKIGGENDFFKLIVTRFFEYDEAHSNILPLISTLIDSHFDNAKNFILSGGLEVIIKHVFDYEDEEEVDDDQKEAWQIITTLSAFEQLGEYFWEKKIVHQLIAKLEDKLTNINVKANILLVLGHLAAHEESMNYLFERSDLLCDLLLHGEKPVKIGAAITIGNIARTDENCVKLGEKEGVVDALLSLLKTDDNPQVHHLCLGALKNIAIPSSNKSFLFNKGTIETVSELIGKANNAHIFFNSVLLLKIILNSKEEIMADEFHRVGLKPVVELFKKELLEEQMRIQFEAARLLLNFSAIHNDKYRDEVVKEGGVFGLKFLLKSSFPLLQNEGLDFFTRLAEVSGHQSVFEDYELLSLIHNLTTSSDPSVNTKSSSLLSSLKKIESIEVRIKDVEEGNVPAPEGSENEKNLTSAITSALGGN